MITLSAPRSSGEAQAPMTRACPESTSLRAPGYDCLQNSKHYGAALMVCNIHGHILMQVCTLLHWILILSLQVCSSMLRFWHAVGLEIAFEFVSMTVIMLVDAQLSVVTTMVVSCG